jgi:choline-sulfatase
MRRLLLLPLLFALACGKETPTPPPAEAAPGPSILLVTLDTTRADAIGPEQHNVETPSFNALAQHALRFRQAYTAVPQTLPAHLSLLTGLYPAGHGVHENARRLSDKQSVLAERLHAAGYHTAAFVSAFALARRFGTARGFEVWDEDFGPNRAERTAGETTDRALAYLQKHPTAPLFVWVHYYDPHFPYTPPEPFRTRYAAQPYFGEVAYMDQQLGRLLAEFRKLGDVAIILVGDHGEGLGDHGEQQHGNLLYQSTMHVPLLVAGPGVNAGVADTPVSTRRIYNTILGWAGLDPTNTLLRKHEPEVMGEAMKPFLDYGWQPQVMAIERRLKTIMAGSLEVYDIVADPGETHNLAGRVSLPRGVRRSLRDYPIPTLAEAASSSTLTEEERRQLASLGYVSAGARPVIRKDAPRPADMAPLFPLLDEAAALFVREQYAQAIPLLERILQKDPRNLDAALRLATSYSQLGREQEAAAAFERAHSIAPQSPDVKIYLALHLARGRDWQRAVPMLEQIVAASPNKVPAIEALALLRERQGRDADALALLERLYTLRTPSSAELVHEGELAMRAGNTPVAIDAFEKAHADHELELGVLYLAAGRYADARDALDRVPPSHPDYAMALFKRAQVAVLLHEADAPARIAAARAHASAVTRPLIERERLFAGM